MLGLGAQCSGELPRFGADHTSGAPASHSSWMAARTVTAAGSPLRMLATYGSSGLQVVYMGLLSMCNVVARPTSQRRTEAGGRRSAAERMGSWSGPIETWRLGCAVVDTAFLYPAGKGQGPAAACKFGRPPLVLAQQGAQHRMRADLQDNGTIRDACGRGPEQDLVAEAVHLRQGMRQASLLQSELGYNCGWAKHSGRAAHLVSGIAHERFSGGLGRGQPAASALLGTRDDPLQICRMSTKG